MTLSKDAGLNMRSSVLQFWVVLTSYICNIAGIISLNRVGGPKHGLDPQLSRWGSAAISCGRGVS